MSLIRTKEISMSLAFLEKTFWGNEMVGYLVAAVTVLVGIVLTNFIRIIVIGRLQRLAKYSSTDLDDRLLHLIEMPVTRLLYLGSFYLGASSLSLHPILEESINFVCIVLATLLVVRLTGSLVEYGLRVYVVSRQGDTLLEQSLGAVVPAIKVAVWAVGIVFLLDNMGFDISAVVASLGIGGVAIALASQGVLADLFSYFSILFDRPFEIGDFLVVGELVGTVDHIGIKTTRLNSLSGEELVVANTDLTSSRIQNFRRMQRRRIAFNIGVTYETSQAQMTAIPDIIKAAIEGAESVTFDRAHFLAFSDFSLDYEVVYFVETNDYVVYVDAQQHINLAIKAAFEAEGIEFAYPTQSLYLNTVKGAHP